MADVQIAIIDQQNTQIALAAPSETEVTVAVPGVQGPVGEGVPAGGTANQVLFKQSGTDYDTAWSNVTSDMISDLEIVNADDYEEGVWGSTSAANRRYTKVGSLVHCTMEIDLPTSGTAFSQTLPFTVRIGTSGYSAIEVGSWFIRKSSSTFPPFPVSSQCLLRLQGSGVQLVNATGSGGYTTVSELRSLFSYPSGAMQLFASFSYITNT